MAKSNIVRLADEMRAQASTERDIMAKPSPDAGGGRNIERRPLLREKPEPETYPVEALGELAPLARTVQSITQTPIEMCAHGVLAPLNHGLQAHVDVEYGFGPRPISLFLVVSAESGSRKSTVDSLCMRGTYRYQEHLLQQASARNKDEDALSPIFVVTEPTIDALLGHFAKSIGNLCLCNPEVGSMIGGFAFRKENALGSIAKLSDCWDGKFTCSLRVTSANRVVHGKRLNAALMGQPEVIARLYSPMAKAQGFTSRLLTCEPKSLVGTRKWRVPESEAVELMERFADYIFDVLSYGMPLVDGTRNVLEPRVIPLTAKAMRLLGAFADDTERACAKNGRFEGVREFGSKAAEHAARLGALLAVYDDFEASNVGAEFVDSGIALAQWYTVEALRISGGAEEETTLQDAKRLLEWMQGKQREVFSLVEVYQRANTAARSAAKARALVNVLMEHGWLVRNDEPVAFDGQMRKEAYRLT